VAQTNPSTKVIIIDDSTGQLVVDLSKTKIQNFPEPGNPAFFPPTFFYQRSDRTSRDGYWYYQKASRNILLGHELEGPYRRTG
jgi:hypothetical protein